MHDTLMAHSSSDTLTAKYLKGRQFKSLSEHKMKGSTQHININCIMVNGLA